MGLQFGSSVTPDSTYYIPTTFLSTNNTYVLLPSGTCEAFGISQTNPIGLLELVGTITNTNSLLSSSSFNTGFNISGNYSISFGSISVLCTDTDVQVLQNASGINNLLYCGYEQSRCNGTSFIQEYSAAWDFGNSSASSLSLNAWYNQTSTTAGGGGPGTTFRLPGLLNLGVKAWWMESVSNASSVPSVELLGLMSMPIPANKLSLDFSSLLGPLFYTWVVQLLFPTL
ncbi:hypothetical protein CEUSTIGMA_g13679.t1 [Chlamydomonas eustigma]|uniref:Uncharacterized protein n=1 Tax=Chlamydomonas eustigma TaxID=1157962 RepID=A0A250XT67_9CHLO|nr:hypothetical protein CEUSTIGMA_g13679.t1 [Chlamydomonas eustigma]|eukprot:GAX86267.1 hypothetical protein CEUSTIGMA_g13679.t1 [Chlamydomonas eustigma]